MCTKDAPLVSVRVMAFNHALFIKEAIDSIMMQEANFKIEIVVGDDFSTDNTLEIVREYKPTKQIDIRVLDRQAGDDYWRKRQVLGRLYNFTNIIENCRGKYVALLDGDDYWTDKHKLQKQVNFLENHPSFGGSFHSVQVINEPKKDLGGVYGENAPEVYYAEDTLSTGSLFHSSSFLFKRSAFSVPDWFFKIVSADMALFSIVAGSGPLKKFPEIMSVYRKHPGGITSSSSVINSYHQKRIELIQYLDAYHGYKYKKKAEEVINYHTNELAHNKVPPKKKSLLMKWKAQLNLRKRIKKLFS